MLRPLKDRVIVRQDAKKEKLGSLYVPDNTRELYDDFGVIEAIGSGVKLDVKVGDRVMFKRRPASSLGEHGHKDLIILTEEDLLAVVTDE